jgi:probable DNA metabolism protein
MHQRTDVVYVYDGTFEGLLCAVFACYEFKETPADIRSSDAAQMTLYPIKTIETDLKTAERMRDGLLRKCGREAYGLAAYAFYTCLDQKELLIYRFVRIAMAHGPKALQMLTDDTVLTLQNAVRALKREAHQYQGFVRFSIHGNVMAAVIEPKNEVLSLIAPHFCDRFANEAFMIYDKTHGQMLLYRAGRRAIISVDRYDPPEADESEENVRSLWKLFYETVAIRARTNPKCRMSHMQKRYWKHLPEMDGRTIRRKQPGSEEHTPLPVAERAARTGRDITCK